MTRLARLAVLCSGFGSNLQAIIEAVRQGEISAEVCCVISDNREAYCLKRAQQSEISTAIVDPQKYPTRSEMDRAILTQLQKYQVDWIILAGFMRILGPKLIHTYRNRILNIHPALLPNFPGVDAIRKAWEAKVSVTGVTVHFVNEGVDTGPIIEQEEVEIRPNETLEQLEQRIHQVEHRLYPRVIQRVITTGYGLKGVG